MKDEKPLEYGYIEDIDEDGGTIIVPYEDKTYVFLIEDISSEHSLDVGQSVKFTKKFIEDLDVAEQVERVESHLAEKTTRPAPIPQLS